MKRLVSFTSFVALLLAAAPARAETPAEIVAAARAEGLPADMLEAKWREAKLKRAPESATVAALARLHAALEEADRLVAAGPSETRAEALRRAAQALAAGVPAASLKEALAPASDLATAARAAQAMAALAAARVAPAAAVGLVTGALHAGLADRLLTLRPAVELLEAAGFGADEAARLLAADAGRGVPPLESAGERTRDARTTGRAPAGESAPAAGAAASDRERSAGRGSEAGSGASGSAGSGGNGAGGAGGAGGNGAGNGNGGGHGKP